MRFRRSRIVLLALTMGLAGVAVWLLVPASGRGHQARSGVPACTNGGFDQGLDGWRLTPDSVGRARVRAESRAAPATHSLELNTTRGGKAEVFQEIAIPPGRGQRALVISADVRSSLPNGFGRLTIVCLDSRSSEDERKHYGQLAEFNSPEVGGTADWASLRVPFRVPAQTDRIVLSVQAFGDGDFSVTNVRIEEPAPAGATTRSNEAAKPVEPRPLPR